MIFLLYKWKWSAQHSRTIIENLKYSQDVEFSQTCYVIRCFGMLGKTISSLWPSRRVNTQRGYSLSHKIVYRNDITSIGSESNESAERGWSKISLVKQRTRWSWYWWKTRYVHDINSGRVVNGGIGCVNRSASKSSSDLIDRPDEVVNVEGSYEFNSVDDGVDDVTLCAVGAVEPPAALIALCTCVAVWMHRESIRIPKMHQSKQNATQK